MKRTYAFIVAGAILMMSGGLTSCSGENTTGVDTTNTEAEAGSGMNNSGEAAEEYGDGSTGDYDGAGENTGADDSDAPIGMDTARTTTPSVDNGN
ncbi:hypothetical protein ACFS7Z_17835 [Pontibacter toksunensis]|uniref:Uncharacterized protein n=1 Tax=Pontibacter toksunensis TaxID=1332631 RepID=A0ABW6BYT0_9BACT